MRRALSLTDISILVVAMVMSLFFFLNGRMGSAQSPAFTNFEQSYEMPRPQKWFRQYMSLLGRGITYMYNNPFEKKVAATDGAQYRNQAVAPPPAAKTAVKKKDAKKTAKKAATLEVTHTETARVMGLTDTAEADTFEPEYAYEAPMVNDALKKDLTVKKVKKTITKEEWENRILSDNSVKSVTEFAKEYKSGKVTEADYYTVINTLLKHNDPFKAGLGVYGLGLTPSAKSFVLLAAEVSLLPTETKEQASLTLNTYSEYERFPILAQVLGGTEESAHIVSLQILAFKIKNILNPTANTQKTTEVTSVAYKQFTQLVSPLTALAEQSPSPAVKEASLVLLKQIESLNR